MTIKAYWAGGGNWGDEITPYIIHHLTGEWPEITTRPGRVLGAGSIIEFVQDGDVIWGSGVISSDVEIPKRKDVTVLAVRGPLTRDRMVEAGYDVPEVYGDPALLMPDIIPSYPGSKGMVWIPHYVDQRRYEELGYIDIRSGVGSVLVQANQYSVIISSSLHGIILGDVLGKDTYHRSHPGVIGGDFKFMDYRAGMRQGATKEGLIKAWEDHFA